MSPSRIEYDDFTVEAEDHRPCKRRRRSLDKAGDSEYDEDVGETAIPPHPLGVKPSGNAYSSRHNLKTHAGLFARLPDELIALILEGLDARELLAVGHTCKALYAYAWSDDLWKVLMTNSTDHRQRPWRGSWRSTFLGLLHPQLQVSSDGLFSDLLHRPFFCAHTPLSRFARNIPKEGRIPRRSNLTWEDYSASWTNKPFILTEPVTEWPVYGKWTEQSLLRDYAEVVFRAECVDWSMKTYVDYLRDQTDESPLYLFDRSFAEKMNLKVGSLDDHDEAAYWAPTCFGEDLFDVLVEQRPDRRWLIMGPARSGSTFHKDPNATSAWNAVLTGSKYWLMFPASAPPPPGVIVSEDGSEVTAPVSIAEYLLTFHEIARATPGCMEGICYAGEVLHVPSGWFHLVLNLEDSIALTQNFVPERRLPEVLRFMRDTPDQVSGFKANVKDPYGLFVDRLREKHPALLERALERLDGPKKSATWEKVKQVDETNGGGGGFSFGFGNVDDDDDADIP